MMFAPIKLLSLDGFGLWLVAGRGLVLPIRVLAIFVALLILSFAGLLRFCYFVVVGRLLLVADKFLDLCVECNNLFLLCGLLVPGTVIDQGSVLVDRQRHEFSGVRFNNVPSL